MNTRPLYQSRHQHAEGNLQYLDFIKLVDQLWTATHPEIPFFASGGKQDARYPSIIYSLQVRRPHPNEPKPRFREDVRTAPGEDTIIITAQRFQNVINFAVVTENDPQMAELIIEAFEDFMLEMTPVFKEMGVSEFVYARRLPDDEDDRMGEDIVVRKVAYMVTTEKIRQTTEKKLNHFVIHARLGSQERPYATIFVVPTEANAPGAILLQIEDPDVWVAPVVHLRVYGASFQPGDAVTFERVPGSELPLVSMPEAITEVYTSEDILGVAEGTTFYVLGTHEANVGLEYSFTTAAGFRVLASNPQADVAVRFVRSGSVYVIPGYQTWSTGDGSATIYIEDDFQGASAG
jgi:hypothetical protein